MDTNRNLLRASTRRPLLAFLLSAGLASSAQAQDLGPQGILVNARSNERESFSNGQVDQALARASSALMDRNGDGDFACGEFFVRQGELEQFSGPNNVATRDDLNAVLAQPSLVKVVNDIRFCDDRMDVNFVGCTRGSSIALEDVSDPGNNQQSPDLDGIVWAHEFGHATGLKDQPANPDFIMSAVISPANTFVTVEECINYTVADRLNTPPLFNPDAGARLAAELPVAERQGPVLPIEEFVKSIYVDAMPVDAMLRYGASDLPVLERMLSDRAAAGTWPMVAAVLGMIGDETTASRLIEFIEAERDGQLSRGEYNGIRSAIQSLGFLANRAQSGVALDYLMNASKPEFWANQRSMSWTSVAAPTATQRNGDLASVADMGLGLSGDPRALDMLQTRWSETARAGAALEERQELLGLLEQAMMDNAKIERVGLVEYYRN